MSRRKKPSKSSSSQNTWIFGLHAVKTALENSKRTPLRILVLESSKKHLPFPCTIPIAVVSKKEIEAALPKGAKHQGIAVLLEAAPTLGLEDLLDTIPEEGDSVIVILDQVTDPHNVGAILRSAAAFSASALIVTEHNSASLEGVVAKVAAGAMEQVPIITIVNLARTLETLQDKGFWCIGLDEAGDKTISEVDLSGKIALLCGSEGNGLRPLTKKVCDLLVQLPTNPSFPTLNVSNAAAVALYETVRQKSS